MGTQSVQQDRCFENFGKLSVTHCESHFLQDCNYCSFTGNGSSSDALKTFFETYREADIKGISDLLFLESILNEIFDFNLLYDQEAPLSLY